MKTFRALAVAAFMLSMFSTQIAGAQSSAGAILETMNSFSGDVEQAGEYLELAQRNRPAISPECGG